MKGASIIWSICIPDTCSADDLLVHFKKKILTLTEGIEVSVSTSNADCFAFKDQKPITYTELGVLYVKLFNSIY